MSTAVARIRPSDLESLWARSEPDLELDTDGWIRQIQNAEPTATRGSAIGSIASAVPTVVGTIISEAARWD